MVLFGSMPGHLGAHHGATMGAFGGIVSSSNRAIWGHTMEQQWGYLGGHALGQ